MAVTTDDLNAVVAQWEEWTADAGFRLSIEVKVDDVSAKLAADLAGLGARVDSESRYILVQVHHGEHQVFSERIPYTAEALRASVTVLARTIAARSGDG